MDPVDVTARLADVQVLSSIGWAIACSLAGYIFVAGRLQDRKDERGCPECSHCRSRREHIEHERQAKQEAEARRNLRWLGLSDEQIEAELE